MNVLLSASWHRSLAHPLWSIFFLYAGCSTLAIGDEESWSYGISINNLETLSETHTLSLDTEIWAARDVHTLLISLEVDKTGGTTGPVEIQALYRRIVTNNWNLHAGWRKDVQPHPQRQWLVAGMTGISVAEIETEVTAYAGSDDRTALTLAFAREFQLAPKLSMVPELELNFYGKSDAGTGTGDGLSDLEAALRLHYAFSKQFSPYIGIQRTRLYNESATIARTAGDPTGETYLLAGISAWF